MSTLDVSLAMRQRALTELTALEREQAVRVLLAVESGSRAWGFASPDSDYDVRLIYVHARDWYLTVLEGRDVIEAMLPGDLDLSGWDLRKALRLFAKCNLGLNEWLGSPIVYSQVPEFAAQLRQLVPLYFNPIAAMHHYRSMAQTTLTENLAGDRISIKKLFYVLRPLLACRWIARTQAQPPTEFAALVAPEWVTNEERDWIAKLLQQKARAVEAEQVEIAARHLESLRNELDQYKDVAGNLAPPPARTMGALDTLLRSCLEP